MAVRAGLEIPGVTLGGVLGRGASAVVYLGTQERFGRNVAVKVLDMPQGTELTGRLFRSECRTLGRLASHPNILTLFDAGFTAQGQPYLVSEYLPAGTLADRLRRDGPLEWPDAIVVAVQLAGALETTHLHDVAHGDLKPQNVLVGRMGQPVLADFGIARLMSVSNSTALSVLTPLHSAPELFEGADPAPSSDIYALGSTLFQLLDGESAVGAPTDSPLVVVRRVAAGERRALDPGVAPPGVVDLIGRCLAPDPAARPAAAADVGRELQEIQRRHGHPVTEMPVMGELPDEVIDLTDGEVVTPVESTLPPDEWQSPERPGRLRRVALGAAAAVVLVGGLVAWVVSSDGGGDAASRRLRAVAATTTTVAHNPDAGSGKGGIQPGVRYALPGVTDSSSEMATRLAEQPQIFGALEGHPVADSPFYRLSFTALPAGFRFQSFNPLSTSTCESLTTKQLTLRGLWERGGTWDGGRLQVSVAEFVNPADAHEMFTAASLGIGATAGECFGLGRAGVSDITHFGAVHRDVTVPGGVAADVPYNTWRTDKPEVGGTAYARSTRMILEYEQFLIDVYLLSDGRLLQPDEQVMAEVADEIRVRL